MLHEVFEQRLGNLRGEIIEQINSTLKKLEFEEINFNDGATLNYIDDQLNEVISRYNCETQTVFTDKVFSSDSYSINEMDTDTLLWILEQVETENYN